MRYTTYTKRGSFKFSKLKFRKNPRTTWSYAKAIGAGTSEVDYQRRKIGYLGKRAKYQYVSSSDGISASGRSTRGRNFITRLLRY